MIQAFNLNRWLGFEEDHKNIPETLNQIRDKQQSHDHLEKLTI